MLFFSLIALLITNQCGADLLPGIDDIASGYDAAKMLSASEQNSKYRIFDLSELRATEFNTRVLGKTRLFQTPKLVQVTGINLRKQDTCETITRTFESFYQSYFRSTSFGVGVGVPGLMSLSVGYRHTLKEIQEAITKSDKVIGVSTIWWGQYSVQLAPPFLLKLDSMFSDSVDMLASEALNPSTENDQAYYNQFIQTFGTHYVSRIVVGGTAHLYTLMDSTFHKTSSYREVSEQVSLMFQFKQFQGTVGRESGLAWSKMKDSFRSTASTLSLFQPPVESENNRTDWETWQQTAGDQPVVVNRTLFAIHDLIRNKPTVREHLRRTVQFYLKTGMMPTLAQLNNPLTARSSFLPAKPVGPINGLDVVGCGYNVLSMESKLCILDQSNFTEREQWSDPFNKSAAYSLPNGWFAVNTPESLSLDGSFLITSVEDYFRRTTRTTVTDRRNWFGTRRTRTEKTTTDFYRRFYQDYYNLIVRMKQIAWYTLSVRAFPYPTLTSIAQAAFDRLPKQFSPNDLPIWQDFFDQVGTHLVVSSTMGGQVWAEIWYEHCLTHERTEQWIHEQTTNSWLWISHSTTVTQEHQLKIDEQFRKHSTVSLHVVGGDQTINPFSWDQWITTVKHHPRPISYRLMSLDEILPDSDRRKALRAAIDHVLKIAQKEERTYINQLQSVRGPPKKQCSRNEIRTRRQAQKIDNDQMNRDLCPWVGYKGTECPGKMHSGRYLIRTNAPRLPVGVGMTIDITTGTLLYPALEYTYLGNNQWNGTLSNTTYQVPRGIVAHAVTEKDNAPVVRIFHTAAELSNEWKYERLRGSWLGGEFGHSRSLLDIYSRFFSKNQAIAVTQKPTALYRLYIDNLQLNKYVKEALQLLPRQYNETLYSDFIRTWGTHIVQQALIGGMREQQVLFKDCVFSFNGAITSDNLVDYLKRDILSQTLGNNFYADRRKITLDHWLGGDPSEMNETRWQLTIASNPALLKIEEYLPWWEVREVDPVIRGHLKYIIQARTTAADKIRIDEEDLLAKQLINGSHLARDGYIGLVNNGRCIITPTTFASVKDCADGCITNVLMTPHTDFLDNRLVWYLRDETTGYIRTRTRVDAQTVLEGPNVNVGCSSIHSLPGRTTSAHICVACDLVDSFANQCVCVCPKYPTSSVG